METKTQKGKTTPGVVDPKPEVSAATMREYLEKDLAMLASLIQAIRTSDIILDAVADDFYGRIMNKQLQKNLHGLSNK